MESNKKENNIDESKFVELSGHANIDAKEIFRGFGNLGQITPNEEKKDLTFGNLFEIMIGGMLFKQLMDQPISEELLKQMFTPTDKKDSEDKNI